MDKIKELLSKYPAPWGFKHGTDRQIEYTNITDKHGRQIEQIHFNKNLAEGLVAIVNHTVKALREE